MTNGDYKFGMKVLDAMINDAMINDAIKKKAGYMYYMAKKVENEKAKIVNEPEEQHVSPVKRGRGKGFMCYGDQVVNAPSKLKKDVVPKKTRSLTITKETVVGELAHSIIIQEPRSQRRQRSQLTIDSQTDEVVINIYNERRIECCLQKYYDSSDSEATLHSSSLDKPKEGANETNDADESDMDLSDDNPQGDDDDVCKPNMTHPTNQKLYDTLYEFVYLDHDALNAQDAEPSFHKRSSRRKKSPMIHAQVDTPSIQPLDPKDEYVQNHPNPEWFPKKSGSANAKRRMTWFDLLLKLDINQNENHILEPSTIVIAKKIKEIIQKDELTITDLEGARLERLKQKYQNNVELEYHVEQLKAAVLTEAKQNSKEDDVSKPRSFKRYMSKNTKPHPSFYNNNFYYRVCLSTEKKYITSITKHYAARYYNKGIKDMISDIWCIETHRYIFEALKVVRVEVKKKWGYGFLSSIVVRRSDDQEYEFSYADLSRLSLNDVEDMCFLQVQDKLHHLPLEFVKNFNNALLLLIRRVVIQNRVEDIQLGVESYPQTLNLTNPMMFFEGID
ncbi:hypothetical protein Tco_1349727 [Tanacetum coccineum]